MAKYFKHLLILALLVTIAAIVTWRITGGDYYTKFEVVEQVTVELDQNDPLVAAGFYEDQNKTETVHRNEFRLGLLPTPSNIFDKHLLSVASLSLPWWILTGIAFILHRRKNPATAAQL